ncbi:MAG: leucine-rich repeat protein [Clostridia bacterium]|nr:leucine-rich repeat protein [Clostridia bacterium]
MKKAFSLALVLTLLLSAVCVFPVSAERFLNSIDCGEYWYILLDDGTAAIGADNHDLSGTLIIPDTINGYTVTEIANSGFIGTNITEVVMPNTVTRINDYAFADNEMLQKVNIPEGVTFIGEGAFKNCHSLRHIFIPASVTDIGVCAIGYEDLCYYENGELLFDGGYIALDHIEIEGFKGSAAEEYSKQEYQFDFIEYSIYKDKVLELLHISEEDPETGEGYLAYYKEVYEYFSPQSGSKDIPTFVLIRVYENVSGPAFAAEVFGDYILRSSSHLYPTTFGYYVYYPEKNEIYPLPNAYKMEFEGIENVFTLGGVGELIGDVNYDRELNIRDATLIQKSLAGLAKIERNAIEASDYWLEGKGPAYIGDFNRDREMNIRDATAIQKKIAGL